MSAIRVMLVDDHEMVRQGLRLLLESVLHYEVVEASSGPHALALLTETTVDAVLLDARMPEHDGIWTLQRIRAERPELPVLMLSTYDTADYVEGALDNGAAGYLLKDASSQQVGEAVATALEGRGVYLHPQVAQRLLGRRGGSPGHTIPLSTREQEILELLVGGRSTEDIGLALHLATATVKSHLTSIFRKLRVTNRTQAVAKALQDGLVRGGR
ncbi:MAG: response regulator transcription factor [Actinobacteria bacterium]|jgi:DNA-binding NarL/FixJ family response regulator|nr:response regulator transcription factor [Actinomycetota bacterium]